MERRRLRDRSIFGIAEPVRYGARGASEAAERCPDALEGGGARRGPWRMPPELPVRDGGGSRCASGFAVTASRP